MWRLREVAEKKAEELAAKIDEAADRAYLDSPVGDGRGAHSDADDDSASSDGGDMSDGEREFRAERAKRLELLGGMDSARKGKGAINSSLAFLKKAAQDVGEFLEEADAGGMGIDMGTGGMDFGGDFEEAIETRLEREREEREEREREAERLAAERRAQLQEWRVRAQVARDEVIAERQSYAEEAAVAAAAAAAAATDSSIGAGRSPRGRRKKAGSEAPVLTVSQAVAALRFALGFAEDLNDPAVVEKALHALGLSVPNDASRRAKASVSCAALHIHTGWPPPVVGLVLTPGRKAGRSQRDEDSVIRSFDEWRTSLPNPEPEPEPAYADPHLDPLDLDSSTDSATTASSIAKEEDAVAPEPLGVVEAAECLRRALRLSVGSDLPLPTRLRVRDEGIDEAARRASQLLTMVARAAATQTEVDSDGETLWELLDTQCQALELETGWTAFNTVRHFATALCACVPVC